jgi:hypothetical protein
MHIRTTVLYGIALFVACAIVGGGVWFVRDVQAEIKANAEQVKQKLKAQKEAGQLPPEWKDVDLDNLGSDDFQMQVSQGFMIRWDMMMWLKDFGLMMIPFVVAFCLGIATLVDWLARAKWRNPS